MFALNTHAVCGYVGCASGEQGAQDFQKLIFVDRTTTQFKVHKNMLTDRRGCVERFDITRLGVNNGEILFDVLEIAKGLGADIFCGSLLTLFSTQVGGRYEKRGKA